MPGAEESISEVSGKEVLGNSHWLLERDDHLPPTNSCVQLYMPQQARFTASWGNSSRTQQRGGLPLSVSVCLCVSLSLSVCQSVCLWVFVSLCVFVCPSAHVFVFVFLSDFCMSVCPSAYLWMSVFLVCLSLYLSASPSVSVSLSLSSVPPLRLTANII